MTSRASPVRFRFRIYISGQSLNSQQAVANLYSICQEYLSNQHEIEVVDVFRDPARALADRIMMTPTLLCLEPSPPVRIVGTLSETSVVLAALNITPDSPPG